MFRKKCFLGLVLVLILSLMIFQGQLIGLGDGIAPPPPSPPSPPEEEPSSNGKEEEEEEEPEKPLPDLEIIKGKIETQTEGYKVSLLVKEGGIDCSQVPVEIFLSPMKAWMGEWPFLIRKEKPDFYQANKEKATVVIFVVIPESWSLKLKKQMEYWYEVKDRDPEKNWLFIRLNMPFPKEEKAINNHIWIPLPNSAGKPLQNFLLSIK